MEKTRQIRGNEPPPRASTDDVLQALLDEAKRLAGIKGDVNVARSAPQRPHEGKLREVCVYQRVVRRTPVPFQPNAKNPKYLLCYVREELECGHTIDI